MQALLLEQPEAREAYVPAERDVLLVDPRYLPHDAQVTMTQTQFAMALLKALYALQNTPGPQPEAVQSVYYLACICATNWSGEEDQFPPYFSTFLNWGLPNTLSPPYVFAPGFDTKHTIQMLHFPISELIQRGYVCMVSNEQRELAVAVGLTEDRKDLIIVRVPRASKQFTLTEYDIPQPRIALWNNASTIEVLGALHVNPDVRSSQV